MKKTISILLIFVMIFSLSSCASPSGSAQKSEEPPQSPGASQSEKSTVITFTDTYLEEAVRAAMKRPQGDITAQDVAAITTLDLSNKDWDAMNAENGGIKDISDIKYFTGLTELHLDFNDIKDFSALAALTKLSTLTFNGVRVKDLSPLKGLENMTCLVFDWSYAPDQGFDGYGNLDFMVNMKKLEVFESCNAGITDISALGGLMKLWSVALCDNQIADISSLANLKALKELSLINNPIKDFSPIKEIYSTLQYSDFELK